MNGKSAAPKTKLAEQFSQCCAEFRAEIYQIANDALATWQLVYSLWRAYSASCEAGDQSPVLFEFRQNYLPMLTAPVVDLECCCCGDGTRGRQWWNRDTGYGLCNNCIGFCAVSMVEVGESARSYGVRGVHWDVKETTEVEKVTQGRTIWDSDGTEGPCLICVPSFEAVNRMVGLGAASPVLCEPYDGSPESFYAELAEIRARNEDELRDEEERLRHEAALRNHRREEEEHFADEEAALNA